MNCASPPPSGAARPTGRSPPNCSSAPARSTGHERVGLVAGPGRASTSHDRARGFLSAFAEAGTPVDGQHVQEAGFTVEAGYEAALALLRSTDPPTAIFAMSDYSALGVIGAYRDNGLIVGQDFALVGYHDISISRS